MSVYIDSEFIKFGRMKMCHMVADTEQELEDMAIQLGLKLSWWQYKGTPKSHFDVSKSIRQKAISLGAIPVEREQFVIIIRQKKDKHDDLHG